ncbi:MAG TPA: FAD-binding oxidoreductase, partial [Duganella sp.]|nr:FAD-binding oxidoreductase [Duganella sp.]
MNAPLAPPPLLQDRKRAILAALRGLLPPHCLLSEQEDTRPYECDGLTAYRQLPLAVALPETEAQLVELLKACGALRVPIVPRE